MFVLQCYVENGYGLTKLLQLYTSRWLYSRNKISIFKMLFLSELMSILCTYIVLSSTIQVFNCSWYYRLTLIYASFIVRRRARFTYNWMYFWWRMKMSALHYRIPHQSTIIILHNYFTSISVYTWRYISPFFHNNRRHVYKVIEKSTQKKVSEYSFLAGHPRPVFKPLLYTD